jgi:hypothetical protein
MYVEDEGSQSLSILLPLLDEFAKLRKASINFLKPVCQSK